MAFTCRRVGGSHTAVASRSLSTSVLYALTVLHSTLRVSGPVHRIIYAADSVRQPAASIRFLLFLIHPPDSAIRTADPECTGRTGAGGDGDAHIGLSAHITGVRTRPKKCE
ncbi:unnamed protein product [Arctia plantaginis]|uniref:Uncharacterized protein n=1 Tax=Arctia plantaginis TaxID=874455 RepID=A0A8S0YYQ3_ARCPL|nr:unnamed protein product [Arctia plantaginis]